MGIKLWVVSLALLLLQVSLKAQSLQERPLVLQAAELIICGKTNINSFNCSLRKSNLNDTLYRANGEARANNIFNGLEIGFNVEDFGCNLDLMTQDFRKLLKSNVHPQIVMRIDEIVYKGTQNSSGGPVSATVTMLLAGERGIEKIQKASIHKIQRKVIFTGRHEVLMTKFKIEPPTKLFGAVRAEDLLEIEFAIQIQ